MPTPARLTSSSLRTATPSAQPAKVKPPAPKGSAWRNAKTEAAPRAPRASVPKRKGPELNPKTGDRGTAPSGSSDALWGTGSTTNNRRATLTIDHGAVALPDRATFEKLARRDDRPGAPGAREVKFLITGIDTGNPQLYFINSNNHPYHWDFATNGLGKQISLEEFNRKTYFSDSRSNLAGSLIAHDAFKPASGKQGLYTMEFWPTDPVKAATIGKAFKLISAAMPFAKNQLAYHPAGNTQEALFKKEAAQLKQLGVKSIDTTTLFKNVTFSALNPGEGFGMLRVIDGAAGDRPPSARDVVIFKTLPNDLSHVGGVISETPQTPLSHINLKAKQNDTPNAYVKNASTDPRIAPFIGKLVKYEVGPDGFKLREATAAEADAWLESVRPTKTQKPPRDLTRKDVVDLDLLTNADTKAFGAKASNLGELRNVLAAEQVPDGYGVPFSFYDDFMKANGLYEYAKKMMADPKFQSDPAVREQRLADFRERIEEAPVPAALEAKLKALQAKFTPGQGIRCRSSTNNEDLPGFNGAGLYDSYTHRPDEGALSNTVKQVWGSLWNYRAYEEREFNRIDHLAAAMGVAVIPNMDDEKANGVAVTRNIYDPNWPGFYVNVQVGESLVTNPDPAATPDELLISAIGENNEWETQYVNHSSLTKSGRPVLTDDQLAQLREAMEKIQKHFRTVYRVPASNKTFAMDIEFKFDLNNKLVVKQARPWVE